MVFDLDGTLLNTLGDLADSCNHILEKHHYPVHPIENYKYFVGNGLRKQLERALPDSVTDVGEINGLYAEFLAYYKEHSMDKTGPYDGMTAVLEQLNARNVLCAVASNKVHSAMAPLLAHYFPTIRWATFYGQRRGVPEKPHPQVVLDILEDTKVEKEDAIYVGDTATDMQTAEAAGLYKIGALWGFRTSRELSEAGADRVLEHPSQLLEMLNGK